MKNKYLKCITILVLILSFLFTMGCKEKKEDDNNKENITYSAYKLIENGRSDYVVVIPQNAKLNEKNAASELTNWFYESSGISLPLKTDDSVTYSESSKLIILGQTSLTENSGIDVTKIKAQNFTLKTVGSNLFIVGGDDLGTLYGTYEFLRHNFGYEAYASDEIAIDKNVTNRELIDFDLSDGPDIQWRQPNYGSLDNTMAAMRFRLNKSPWMMQNGNFVHNTLSEYLPYKVYGETNGKWYDNFENGDSEPTQLCYSAHGDSEQLELMQKAVIERMKALINYYYEDGDYKELISFTHEDNGSWCECQTCKESAQKYGTDSAVLVKFINPVAKAIDEWMDEVWPEQEIAISIFAYMRTLDAPVKAEGDKFVPIDDSVKLEDNVSVLYAPYFAEFAYALEHSKNSTYYTIIKKWQAVSKKMSFWLYSTNFVDYLGWYDSFNSMVDNYKLVKDCGGYYLFDQATYDTSALTGFDYLKAYLNSKLAWKVDENVNEMTYNFFENYFKQAAKPMRAYFDSYRSWSLIAREELGMGSSVRLNIYSKEYFPKQVLMQWLEYINQAYDAIESVKNSDLALYNRLKNRINKESIAIRYHLIEFWGNTFEKEVKVEMQKSFKSDAESLGFVYLGEAATGMTISKLVYAKWGLA